MNTKIYASQDYVDNAIINGINKWELITDITVDEWTQSVTINQDSEGNAFSLKKMDIFMTLPASTLEDGTDVDNVGYALYDVNGARPAYQSPSSDWENASFYWQIEARGDYYVVHCFKDGGTNMTLFHEDVYMNVGKFETITSFTWRVFNNTMGFAGATFKVYGIRA